MNLKDVLAYQCCTKGFHYLCGFVYSNVFPTCDFFMYKLNRCKYMSFTKSINLFLMKVPFSATGLLGECLKMGLLSLMCFHFTFNQKWQSADQTETKISPFCYYSRALSLLVFQVADCSQHSRI